MMLRHAAPMNFTTKLLGMCLAVTLFACGPASNKGTGEGDDLCPDRCTSFGWEECISPGEYAAPVACSEDEICLEGEGCGVCIPGARYCSDLDEQDLYVCADDGSAGEIVGRCENGEVCSNGHCKDRCAKAEDEPSNVGCNFWAVDLDNEATGGALSNDAAAAQYAVVIANNSYVDAEAKVYINTANVGQPVVEELVKTVAVPARDLVQINLDQREVDGTMGQNGSYTMGSGSGTFVSPHAYRIETNEPVVAYQFNPIIQQFSNDASILIPRQALGSHYYVLGYPTANPCKITGFPGGGTFPGGDPTESIPDYTAITIIGTEDNTSVTVKPTHPIRASSGPSGIVIPATPAGTPINFTINKYDVVNLESDQPQGDISTCISLASERDGDFTGSEVSSSKRVAVFSSLERGVGTGGLEIPEPPGWDGETCCTDHLEQQMFPTAALGWQFAVSRSPIRSTDPNYQEPDIYRVVATVDGTQITTNLSGQFASFTLNAGEWKAFHSDKGFTLKATGGAVMLGQFLVSQGLIPQGGTGDPTFVVFPAAEQHRKDYTFLVPTTFSKNYMVLSKPQTAAIHIDGEVLGEFNDCVTAPVGEVNGVMYDQITCEMSEGVHQVSAVEPFGLTVYGYYNVGSYGYPGGSDVKIINPID
jgi:hypothetical protein